MALGWCERGVEVTGGLATLVLSLPTDMPLARSSRFPGLFWATLIDCRPNFMVTQCSGYLRSCCSFIWGVVL